MDDSRLALLEDSLEEIKASQKKIETALLGSIDRSTVGLLEEARTTRRDLEQIKHTVAQHETKLDEVVGFKRNIKVVVGVIAVTIPFMFELIKVSVGNLWNYLKS